MLEPEQAARRTARSTVKPYILDDASAVEYKRLDLMSKILDPWTRQYLIGLGVGEGWHCLELGGGNGSIAEWLAAKVGASGSVTAIDINPVLIELVPAQNLSVQQMDLRAGELESESYDLVTCRAAASDRRVRPAGIGADGRSRQAGRMADDPGAGLPPRADH
jgi:ubiquinone/menaquinone biosynthesis C-methylase UbiE